MVKLKKVTLRNCRECGFRVSGGGNIHAIGSCVPRGKRGERHMHRRSREKSRRQKAADMAGIVRGVSVAGTGKPSASSDKKASVKMKITGQR